MDDEHFSIIFRSNYRWMEKSFKNSLKVCRDNLMKMYPIYSKNLKEVYRIKSESKKYMLELADIDRGLDDEIIQEQEKSLDKLLKSIQSYNQNLDAQISKFNEGFQSIRLHFNETLQHFSQDEGELTAILDLRKDLLFLCLLLKKFRTGIRNLQLTNNALFSFSDSFQKVKAEYKSNLIQVNSTILEAEEAVEAMARKIEKLN